jgi:hypothetical protein
MTSALETVSGQLPCRTPADGGLGNALVGQRFTFQKTVPATGVISYPPPVTGLNFNLVQWVRHSHSQKVIWLVFESPSWSFRLQLQGAQ